MAGIACGSYDEQGDFIGAAPDSEIVMVKLKEAKKYLTNYFYAWEVSLFIRKMT